MIYFKKHDAKKISERWPCCFKDNCTVQWIFHKPVRVIPKPPSPPPTPSPLLSFCWSGKTSTPFEWYCCSRWTPCLVFFVFFFLLLSALIHNRSGGACCLCALSPAGGGPRLRASSSVANASSSTPSKASITIRRVMALAGVA